MRHNYNNKDKKHINMCVSVYIVKNISALTFVYVLVLNGYAYLYNIYYKRVLYTHTNMCVHLYLYLLIYICILYPLPKFDFKDLKRFLCNLCVHVWSFWLSKFVTVHWLFVYVLVYGFLCT